MKTATIAILPLALLLAFAAATLAQESTPITPTPSLAETVLQEEATSAADLGVAEPTLLPSSPFYFFKTFARGIQRVFTFNPVKRAELELRFTDEKLAEAKKLAETSPERTQAIERAIANYRASQERLKARLEALGETSENPNVDRLLEKLALRTVTHEKLFGELGAKFENRTDLSAAFAAAREDIAATTNAAAQQDRAEAFVRKLEQALVETKGSDFKHLRAVELIDHLEGKAEGEVKERLEAVRNEFLERFRQDLETLAADRGTTTAQDLTREVLEKLPGDKARRLGILEELRGRLSPGEGVALEHAHEALEAKLQDHPEAAEYARQAVQRARELLVKLETLLAAKPDVPAAVRELASQAKVHLERADQTLAGQRFGEAFGQARSAEMLARNALRKLEEVRPDVENLRETMAKLERFLTETEGKIAALTDDLKAKATEALESARLHVHLARETFGERTLVESRRHLEEAKYFVRILEMIVYQHKMPLRLPENCEPPLACPPKLPTPIPPTGETNRVCTQEYAPVCGVDGKTYSNACYARLANITVKSKGVCGTGSCNATCPIYPPPMSDIEAACRQRGGKMTAVRDRCGCYSPLECTVPPATPSPVPSPLPPEVRIQEFKLEADDRGFYPSGTITVGKDTKVKLTFTVRTENVYYGGLDFRSPEFKTQPVKPGDSITVEFTADQPFEFQSYWPLSSVLKATGKVEVQ